MKTTKIKNPFRERKEQIKKWRKYASEDVIESEEVLNMARALQKQGVKKLDSLLMACAIHAEANYFLTTDDKILKKASLIKELKISK